MCMCVCVLTPVFLAGRASYKAGLGYFVFH